MNRNSNRVTPLLFSKEMQKVQRQEVFKRRHFFRRLSQDSFKRLLIEINLWGQRELRSRVSSMIVLTKNSVGRVFATLRYICKRDLEDRPVTPFGGCVLAVKCDECQFKDKSKVSQCTSHLHFKLSSGDFENLVLYQLLGNFKRKSNNFRAHKSINQAFKNYLQRLKLCSTLRHMRNSYSTYKMVKQRRVTPNTWHSTRY